MPGGGFWGDSPGMRGLVFSFHICIVELVPHNLLPLPSQERKEGEKILRLKAMSLQANHFLVSCLQSGVVQP